MENPNPEIRQIVHSEESDEDYDSTISDIEDPFTPREIFNLIKNINDPEHPLTLEQLNVVSEDLIKFEQTNMVSANYTKLLVSFTPTIPHCSMATLIGLCIRVRLERCLPRHRFFIKVTVTPNTHQSEVDINKQLADKERVAAALENEKLLRVVNECLCGQPRMGIAL